MVFAFDTPCGCPLAGSYVCHAMSYSSRRIPGAPFNASSQSRLLFMLYFVPTPGASGAAEGGAAAVFGLFVPWSVAGIMAVTWRLLSNIQELLSALTS